MAAAQRVDDQRSNISRLGSCLQQLRSKHADSVWPVVIGGGDGLLVMLAIEELGRRTKGQTGLITLIAVDVLIDGLVLGLGFARWRKSGDIADRRANTL